jgi:methylmalonyl-CoA/ethylmalonyl-CoA epimerase
MERNGAGLHHVAYRVSDIDATLAKLAEEGVEMIDSSARIGIRGSRVAFVNPRSTGRVLTELVEPAEGH